VHERAHAACVRNGWARQRAAARSSVATSSTAAVAAGSGAEAAAAESSSRSSSSPIWLGCRSAASATAACLRRLPAPAPARAACPRNETLPPPASSAAPLNSAHDAALHLLVALALSSPPPSPPITPQFAPPHPSPLSIPSGLMPAFYDVVKLFSVALAVAPPLPLLRLALSVMTRTITYT